MRSLLAVLFLLFPILTTAQTVQIGVLDSVLLSDVPRLGINAGGRSWWGADQILKNLIDNPGFEAGEFASLVLADNGATGRSMRMAFWDPAWNNEQYGIGWPVGFWNNAEYEFFWGSAKGRSGRVASFRHEGGSLVFDFDTDGTAPQRMSVMRIQRDIAGFNGNGSIVDATSVRPGSPGKQALRLSNGGYSFRYYMDSLWRDGDPSAGKLLVINGEYVCRLWARGLRGGERLRIRFFREGEYTFLDETVALGTDWQMIERRFTVPAGADQVRPYSSSEYHPILAFILEAENTGADVLVDDVELYSAAQSNPTVFTDNFVNRLKELRPGVLRYWAGQLGASLASQLAEPFARRSNGYSPRDRRPGDFCYSLHEFLELCAEIEADPWYVIPPTFSADELRGLVEYLAAPATSAYPFAMQRAEQGRNAPWTEAFGRVQLEYGNEMWGSGAGDDPFMGSSVNGGERLASIAGDRFTIMRAAPFFDASKLRLVIGGQAGFAGRQREIEQFGTAHDAVALAPYFGVLDTWNNDSEIFQPLFASPFWQANAGPMRESRGYLGQREMSIYEINFHTTHGSSPIAIRNDFLAGASGALALPLHMLLYMRELGVKTQCAFSSLGYSFRLANGDMARLWGMLRDVEATGRKRPTWLGVELANKAITGSLLKTRHSTPQPAWRQSPINGIASEITVDALQSFAFSDGSRHGLILFNLSLDQTHRVQLDLQHAPSATAMLYGIRPNSIHDTNEDSTTVVIDSSRITDFSEAYELALPPHSVHALTWTRNSTGVVPTPESALSLDVSYTTRGDVSLRAGLPDGGSGNLEILDILGRPVAPVAAELRGAGPHFLRWTPPVSGIFVAVLRTTNETRTQRITVVK
ncbi:MAG: hypothetical protein M5R41_13265 [Bacteroidia bacterium]|nr:hypothetical protein [Bacteroidia bacterium]